MENAENAEAIWAAKGDDDLIDASRELFNYTEAGEQIIRAELRRRGLPEPDPPIGKCARCGRSIASHQPGDQCSECEEPFPPDILQKLRGSAPDAVLVEVLRTEDPGLIPLAKSILDEENIAHLVRGDDVHNPFGVRVGPAEFWVREEDEARSRALLDGLSAPPAQAGGTDSTATPNVEVILKRFETPDETREFPMGRMELVRIGGVTIGRATYQPGWRWSEHVGPSIGAERCTVEHLGLVLAGTAAAAFDDGRVIDLHEGELFYIPPVPHDSWVVGESVYVSLHFLGADAYARKPPATPA